MPKVIAAFNMTLDGVCDHTAGVADEGLHQHYRELIDGAGFLLYGRITYQLMQYWQELQRNPSGEEAMDEFAASIGRAEKLVFSHTLGDTGWDSARLASRSLVEEVRELREQSGKDILVGSRSLIVQLLNRGLVDELQICIHPVLEGRGMLLFDEIDERIALKFIETKLLSSGSIVLYYELVRE